MKKLVFATQIFSLIAMIPVVVLFEMNHTKVQACESNSTSNLKQTIEIINQCVPAIKKIAVEKDIFSGTAVTFLLFKPF